MLQKSVLVFAVIFYCSVSASTVPKCESSFDRILSEDCMDQWRCVWGNPVQMKRCEKGQRFSRTTYGCIREDGEHAIEDGGCTTPPAKPVQTGKFKKYFEGVKTESCQKVVVTLMFY